jgi:carboxymethylenebutenolidase
VVVAQEGFGVNSHIEDVTRRFADAGFHAVAPHLFHRTGDPALGYDDLRLVVPHLVALTDAGILADVRLTLDHFRSAGFDDRQIGIVGFCMGGRVSFLVAGSEGLGAAVGFYGGGIVTRRSGTMGSLLGLIPTMSTPWLALFGDADATIPVEEVERLRAELADQAPGRDRDRPVCRRRPRISLRRPPVLQRRGRGRRLATGPSLARRSPGPSDRLTPDPRTPGAAALGPWAAPDSVSCGRARSRGWCRRRGR